MITPQKDTLINHYHPEGLRAEIEENQKLTKFIFHQGDILLETDSEDNALSRFTRGYAIVASDRPSDKENNELTQSRYYYQQDEQYSTAFITDKKGTVKNFYKYDAFGNILESQETLPNRITYTGQQYDAITQQYYLRARFYNPILGRFMQEDPYHGDGLNLYAYCKNNPVMYYDPSGYASKQPSCGDKGDQGPEENVSGVPKGSSAKGLGGDDVVSQSGTENRGTANTIEKGRIADFYVTPSGDVVSATGYRYMDSKYAEQTINSMSAPGSYFGFEKFDSANVTQDAFQISPKWSDCKLRGEFDTLQVIDDMYVPTTMGNTTDIPEPITISYPEHGKGGVAQLKVDKIIRFNNVVIIGD